MKLSSVLNEHPKLIWNNRLGGGYSGDTETPEQYIPAQGYPGRDWESCMTMNDTWGYKQDDTNFKSTETLLRNLIDIASKGGNYLLNIGPMATGEVPPAEVERLREMGKWLAVNGESIYATQPTLFGAEAGAFSTTEKDKRGNPKFVPSWKWRSTTGPDKIYIHLFEWPGSTFHLDKMSARRNWRLLIGRQNAGSVESDEERQWSGCAPARAGTGSDCNRAGAENCIVGTSNFTCQSEG